MQTGQILIWIEHALKQWHQKFDIVIINDGFTINEYGKCVYAKIVENAYIIVCLYVDCLLILGTNIEVIKSTEKMLSKKIDMKDLGVADVILRIKITKIADGISLS